MSQEESTNLFHPRLNEDGTFKAKEEADARSGDVGLEGVQTAPLSNPTDVTIPVPPVPTPEQMQQARQQLVYTIPRENMYQELRRLAAEDPEFDKTVKEYAGRKVRREVEDENRALKVRLQEMERLVKERAIASMSQDEIDARLARDPEFAKDFVEIVHGDNSSRLEQEHDLSWASRMESVSEEMLDTAIGLGMPQRRVAEFQEAWVKCPVHNTNDHGFFDHDEQGRFFDQQYGNSDAAYAASIEYFKRVVQYDINELARINQSRRSAPPPGNTTPGNVATPPPQQPPAAPVSQQPKREIVEVGSVNPNLANKTPDLSSATTSGQQKFTAEEVRQWDPEQRMKFFEQFPGGRKEAIERGILFVPGLSESLGYHR